MFGLWLHVGVEQLNKDEPIFVFLTELGCDVTPNSEYRGPRNAALALTLCVCFCITRFEPFTFWCRIKLDGSSPCQQLVMRPERQVGFNTVKSQFNYHLAASRKRQENNGVTAVTSQPSRNTMIKHHVTSTWSDHQHFVKIIIDSVKTQKTLKLYVLDKLNYLMFSWRSLTPKTNWLKFLRLSPFFSPMNTFIPRRIGVIIDQSELIWHSESFHVAALTDKTSRDYFHFPCDITDSFRAEWQHRS